LASNQDNSFAVENPTGSLQSALGWPGLITTFKTASSSVDDGLTLPYLTVPFSASEETAFLIL